MVPTEAADLGQFVRSGTGVNHYLPIGGFPQYPKTELTRRPYYCTEQGAMFVQTIRFSSFNPMDFYEADMKLEEHKLEEHCIKLVWQSASSGTSDNLHVHCEQSVLTGIKTFLSKSLVWARSISGFSSLDINDQIALLNTNWFDVHVLESTLCTMRTCGSNHGNCSHSYIRNSKLARRVISEVAYWFECLKIDRLELVLLKGIVLFNPGKPLRMFCITFTL